ncbi:DUF6478 family protein [Falsirhodobacter xinxiangensis]|uniref:DUF6478 family protein n=1 Tax=Falsirhodobacter xinxiangensis TaxID=2530049 RepID=UPI001FE3EBFD|nr:DUF6478 family protein [Rhodobacter xinxiangensis]
MADNRGGMIDGLLHQRIMNRWTRDADHADAMGLPRLRLLRRRARTLRAQLDRLLMAAEPRLQEAPAIRRPLGTDWAWRPPLWTAPVSQPGLVRSSRAQLDGMTAVFHDCRLCETGARQVRNGRAADSAPFGLQMDIFAFEGSFLSVALDLPPESVRGLRRKHLIVLRARLEVERPLRIFARLNVRHGPNTEQLTCALPMGVDEAVAEFDLTSTKLNEARAEKMWVDLIFEQPQMNQIVLRDLTMVRRPRAEF